MDQATRPSPILKAKWRGLNRRDSCKLTNTAELSGRRPGARGPMRFGWDFMNLRLLQISDSALPVGAFSFSWGLEAAIHEAAIHEGRVNGPGPLEAFTRSWILESFGPTEGVFAGAAFRAVAENRSADLVLINDHADALMAVPSLRTASREMGAHLWELGLTWSWSAGGLETIGATLPRLPRKGWHHAITFGVMGALAEATEHDTLLCLAHQAALGLISAGIRGIPLSPTHGQQMLAYLHGDIVRAAEAATGQNFYDAGNGSPFYEVLCHAQTQLYSRMFRC